MTAPPSPELRAWSRRDFLKTAGAFAILLGWGGALGRNAAAAFATPLEAQQYHFLSRISWGVRAADRKKILRVGIGAYLEEQLKGEKLPGAAAMPNSVLRLTRQKAWKLRNANTVCYKALLTGMVKRAATSPAQLLERMVEFWSDHFNVASEGIEPDFVDYQRTAIRPNALGKFRDLLRATAKHPAMLNYLDNYLNVAEHPNENYAREVMELHTLGVDGGYTERDVKEVARALTGWSYDREWDKYEGFYFDADNHDTEAKRVLGNDLPAGRGIEDGEEVLDLLAGHLSTAKFVCRKLVIRFVSDLPPQTLIDRMVAVWVTTGGDIMPVLRAMLLNNDRQTLTPEFAAAVGKKLRRPLDHFVGIVRTTGTAFSNFWLLEWFLSKLAQVPYGWHPPNGYPEPAGAWANTSGLLERWNVAQYMTDSALNGRHTGMSTTLISLIGATTTVGQLVDKCALLILGNTLAADQRAQLIAFVNTDYNGQPTGGTELTRLTGTQRKAKLGVLCGLLLSSPMFQWR